MAIAWTYLMQVMKIRLAYRWDFLVEFAGELLGSAASLSFLVGIFGGAGVTAIAGWPREAIVFMYGFSMLSIAVFELFAEALYRFSDQYLIEGRFDQVLLRPVSPLLQILLAGFNPMGLTEAAVGGALIAWAAPRLDVPLGPLSWLGLAGLAVCGGVILLSVFVALTSASFWFEDRLGIQPPVYNCIVFGRYPVETFHPVIRFLLRWVIPFAFIGYYPAGIFVAGGRWDAATLRLAWSTPLVAAACAAVAGLLWRAGVRRYHSTGS